MPDSFGYPPRGLSRPTAARYIGVGETKFDQMVADGRMPKPKRIDSRVVWDRLEIDAAFSHLPNEMPRKIGLDHLIDSPGISPRDVLVAKLADLRAEYAKKD